MYCYEIDKKAWKKGIIVARISKRTKKIMGIIIIVILCAVLIISAMMIYGKYQMRKIPELTFKEALEYTTKDNPNAVITVGMIQDDHLPTKCMVRKRFPTKFINMKSAHSQKPLPQL